jgi:transcriptional regulator with XRE-family HTH domain
MQIGEKIKRLRTAKLMTQSELVGGEITRNMLSRIENGAAQPSMATIRYIAERLNVSAGFLLADEADEILYFKSAEIGNIKKAFSNKDYALCREMCKNSEWCDDELMLILAESTLQVAINTFSHGNLHNARDLFDEAISCCYQTIYDSSAILSRIKSYFDYMSFISPTLASNEDDASITLPIATDNFCIYSYIFLEGESNGYKNVPLLDKALEILSKSSYEIHIRAKLLIEQEKYQEGYEALHTLLFNDNGEFPEPMLYFVLGDIELCCKEIDDFKGAYDFSKNKIELMQKLLS